MPYEVRQTDGQFCVYKEADGKNMGCHSSEDAAMKQVAALYAADAEKAAPDGVKTGDMVSWDSSGGRAQGKVTRVVRDGTINVPDSTFTIKGTADNPAALIRLFRDGKPTDTLVGHRFSSLSRMNKGMGSGYGGGKDKKRKKRVLRSLKVKEISAVDKAAQVPAGMVLMKRDEAGEESTWQAAESAGDGHIVKHGEPDMTNHDDAAVTETVQKQLDELTSRAERAEQIIKMDTPTRAFFDGLSEENQDLFLVKSDTERAADVRNAEAADKVVYKSASGTEFRASDDPRLVEMAKRADEEVAKRLETEERLEKADLAKRAESELSNAPGTVEVRGQILKALNGVEGAEEFVKAANEALAGAFTPVGTSEGTLSKAEDRLEELAKAHAEAESVTIEQARAAVLETPEGVELYSQLGA